MSSTPLPVSDDLRYRALVPAFTLLLTVDCLARKAVGIAHPIAGEGGTAGVLVNWTIFGLMLIALLLALRRRE